MYWMTTNSISLIQAGIMKIPYVKKALNIPVKIQHAPQVKSDKNFVEEVKECKYYVCAYIHITILYIALYQDISQCMNFVKVCSYMTHTLTNSSITYGNNRVKENITYTFYKSMIN